MYEAAVPLEMRDTSPVGTGDKKKRRRAHEALCRVQPRHVSTQEDGGVASGGQVKGVEGRDQGLSKFFEFIHIHRVDAVVHVEGNEGLLGVGAIDRQGTARQRRTYFDRNRQ